MLRVNEWGLPYLRRLLPLTFGYGFINSICIDWRLLLIATDTGGPRLPDSAYRCRMKVTLLAPSIVIASRDCIGSDSLIDQSKQLEWNQSDPTRSQLVETCSIQE